MNRRRWHLVGLVVIALLIKTFSFFPASVERYYSTGVYPFIAATQRILFGWIPFSIGDIFYAAVTVLLLYKLFFFIRGLIRKQVTRRNVREAIGNLIFFSLWVYILFNLLWGLNYNRPPMAAYLNIKLKSYSVNELKGVMEVLVNRLNELDSPSMLYRRELRVKKKLFEESVLAYEMTGSGYPFLIYERPSLKPSIYSYVGNYLGFSGYYNPFSGEAQVNTTIPSFVQPFVSCHEIGHQLGFAKENEANFAGFLSARMSVNPAFRYSVYFDMYAYSLNELFYRDSSSAKALHQQLKPQVKKDYATIQSFFSRYHNPIEPVIRSLYGRYLKANDQPGGLRSYNQVVAMLVAYHKRHKNL
jgi:hypothetical protein